MKINLSVNTRPAQLYLAHLAKLTGRSVADVTKSEAASIWKLAASEFKPASQANIKKDITYKTLRKVGGAGAILYQTKRGKIWFSKANSREFQLAGVGGSLVKGWRLGKPDFTEARNLNKIGKDRVKENLKRTLANRGLAGASFVAAIRSLGFDIDSVSPKSKRINAAVKAQAQKNALGYSSVLSNAQGTTVLMTNSSKVAIIRGAAQAVGKAIRVRAAFFRQNLKRDIFLNAEAALKAYPGSGFKVNNIPPKSGD